MVEKRTCKGRHKIMQGPQGKDEMLELETKEKLFEEYDKVRLRRKSTSLKSYVPQGQKRVEWYQQLGKRAVKGRDGLNKNLCSTQKDQLHLSRVEWESMSDKAHKKQWARKQRYPSPKRLPWATGSKNAKWRSKVDNTRPEKVLKQNKGAAAYPYYWF